MEVSALGRRHDGNTYGRRIGTDKKNTRRNHRPNTTEGYNLYRRMVGYKESRLRFLRAKNVPTNNSLAERLARIFKRKRNQAVVYKKQQEFYIPVR